MYSMPMRMLSTVYIYSALDLFHPIYLSIYPIPSHLHLSSLHLLLALSFPPLGLLDHPSADLAEVFLQSSDHLRSYLADRLLDYCIISVYKHASFRLIIVNTSIIDRQSYLLVVQQ